MKHTELFELAVTAGKSLVAEKSPIAIDAAIAAAAKANGIAEEDFSNFKNYAVNAKAQYERLAFQKLPSEIAAAAAAKVQPGTPQTKPVAASSPEAHGATNIESAKSADVPQ